MTRELMQDPGRPSRRVVAQRIRNRVIEYLELASSFEDQQEYERNAPIAYISHEVIEQWQDNVQKDPREDPDLSEVYDPAEIQAMGQFHAVWDAAASALPDDYPPISEVQALPEWGQLRDAARSALAVFTRRGRMSEDQEVDL